jgi:hypothetical protein
MAEHNSIRFDSGYMREYSKTALDAARSLIEDALEYLKGANRHDGWLCKERAQINEDLDKLSGKIDGIDEAIGDLSSRMNKSANLFADLEDRAASLEAEISGALKKKWCFEAGAWTGGGGQNPDPTPDPGVPIPIPGPIPRRPIIPIPIFPIPKPPWLWWPPKLIWPYPKPGIPKVPIKFPIVYFPRIPHAMPSVPDTTDTSGGTTTTNPGERNQGNYSNYPSYGYQNYGSSSGSTDSSSSSDQFSQAFSMLWAWLMQIMGISGDDQAV